MTPEEAAFNATGAACMDSITDARGIGRVMFTADDDGKPYYHFQVISGLDTSYMAESE